MPKASHTVLLHREFVLTYAEARAWTLTQLALEVGVDPKTLIPCLQEVDPQPATMKTLGKLSRRLNVPPLLLKRPEIPTACGDDDLIEFTWKAKVQGSIRLEHIKQLLKVLAKTADIEDQEFHYRNHHQSDLYIDVTSALKLAVASLLATRIHLNWCSTTNISPEDLGDTSPKERSDPLESFVVFYVQGMILPVQYIAIPVTSPLAPTLGIGHIAYLFKAAWPWKYRVSFRARHSLTVFTREAQPRESPLAAT